MSRYLPISLIDWVRERRENSERIAATKTGADREGWLQDLEYWVAIEECLQLLADQHIEAAVGAMVLRSHKTPN